MPRLVVNSHDGTSVVLTTGEGVSVMRAVVDAGIRGMLGDCNGNLSCATCHAYVAGPWLKKIAPPNEIEEAMLEAAPSVHSNSRLTCQIVMNSDLDGLEISIPEAQL